MQKDWRAGTPSRHSLPQQSHLLLLLLLISSLPPPSASRSSSPSSFLFRFLPPLPPVPPLLLPSSSPSSSSSCPSLLARPGAGRTPRTFCTSGQRKTQGPGEFSPQGTGASQTQRGLSFRRSRRVGKTAVWVQEHCPRRGRPGCSSEEGRAAGSKGTGQQRGQDSGERDTNDSWKTNSFYKKISGHGRQVSRQDW